MTEEEYRMVSMNFDDDTHESITPENIFQEWSIELIEQLAELRGVETNYPKSTLRKEGLNKRDLLVKNLSEEIVNSGVALLIRSFDKASLEQLLEPTLDELREEQRTKVGKEVKDDKPFHLSNNFMQKRLIKIVKDAGGLPAYIKDGGFKSKDQKTIYVGLLNEMGADTEESSRNVLYSLCEEEINTFALTNALTATSTSFLRSVCEHTKLSHGGCSSVNILAKCIINGEHYQPKQVKPKAGTKLKKKPKKITKSLKKVDLVYWYKATELRDHCAELGLRVMGKKTELAQRIVDYYDPDKENDVPKPKGKRSKSKGKKGSEKSEKSEKSE